jgi:phage/plasmid-like protein (TIGR03299 family)
MSAQFTSGFFVETAAWHRHGTLFKREDAPQEGRTAMIAGGAGWSTVLEDIYRKSLPGVVPAFQTIPGRKAIVRLDTGDVLNLVSDDYVDVQNVDAFTFFDPVIAAGEASFEAAGTLDGGRTIWVLVKINAPAISVGDGDLVQPYLVLTMGHGNGRAVNVTYTAVRVVCMNTVRWAEKQAGDKMISIAHRGDPQRALAVVRDGIRLSSRTFEIAADQARQLTEIGCEVKNLEQYVRDVWEVEDGAKTPRAFERIEAEFAYGRGAKLASADGTMWGAYNAVTSFLDHTRGRTDESRVKSSWFGDSRGKNARAWELATASIPTS